MYRFEVLVWVRVGLSCVARQSEEGSVAKFLPEDAGLFVLFLPILPIKPFRPVSDGMIFKILDPLSGKILRHYKRLPC